LRKIARAHRQTLLTDDLSDNIASHSFRVALVAWFLAKQESADLYKTVMMALLHDIAETRCNDHNWVHKRYVRVFEEEIEQEQLGTLPYPDLKEYIDEYEERKSAEAVLAKEADLLDQILLLREYEMAGNKEATRWLRGKEKAKPRAKLDELKTAAGKKLGAALYATNPSEWWSGLWTQKNRK